MMDYVMFGFEIFMFDGFIIWLFSIAMENMPFIMDLPSYKW